MSWRVFVVLSVLVACGGPAATPTATPTATSPTSMTASSNPTSTPTPSMPVPSATPARPAVSHGCGDFPTPVPTPIPSTGCLQQPLELPGPGQAVLPGRYTKQSFSPSVAFTVGEGWTASQASTGFFDIQDQPGSLDVVAIQFANVAADSVADAAAEIKSHPDIVVTAEGEPTIDGHAGVLLTVEPRDPPGTNPPVFHPVLTVTAGPLSIASGRILQVILVDVDGEVLGILVGGSAVEWDHAKELADPVVRSITIDG